MKNSMPTITTVSAGKGAEKIKVAIRKLEKSLMNILSFSEKFWMNKNSGILRKDLKRLEEQKRKGMRARRGFQI